MFEKDPLKIMADALTQKTGLPHVVYALGNTKDEAYENAKGKIPKHLKNEDQKAFSKKIDDHYLSAIAYGKREEEKPRVRGGGAGPGAFRERKIDYL